MLFSGRTVASFAHETAHRIRTLPDSRAGAHMDVVNVNRWVSDPGTIGRHRTGELLEHVDAVWVLEKLAVHVPQVVPAHLCPVVPTLQ